nr:MAG TPA: hypothetical protein [Caudoviricetes sp.]
MIVIFCKYKINFSDKSQCKSFNNTVQQFWDCVSHVTTLHRCLCDVINTT